MFIEFWGNEANLEFFIRSQQKGGLENQTPISSHSKILELQPPHKDKERHAA
jgi:hypothetical protein